MEWKNSTRGFLKGTVSRTFLNNSSSHGLIFLHRYYSIAHFLRILLRFSRDSAESKLITVQDSGAQFWDSDEILRQRSITIFYFLVLLLFLFDHFREIYSHVYILFWRRPTMLIAKWLWGHNKNLLSAVLDSIESQNMADMILWIKKPNGIEKKEKISSKIKNKWKALQFWRRFFSIFCYFLLMF